MFDRLAERATSIASLVRSFDPLPREPIGRYAFARRYVGRKRARYVRAAQSLRVSHLTAEDSRIDGFTKVENTDGSTKDPVPRLISTRNPRYGLELGRYLCVVEKDVFRAVAALYHQLGTTRTDLPQTMKGYNLDERGRIARQKWDSFSDPVAVTLDGNRFDQHVSADALRWEHSVYDAVFEDDYLRWLLRLQLVNNGRARCRDGSVIKWRVNGVRQSGDMNTSLGNCMLMSVITLEICHNLGISVELLNDGDDTTVIMDRSALAEFSAGLHERYLEYGFSVRVEQTVQDFERIVFCQFSPVLLPGGWRFVRDPAVHATKVASGVGNWARADSIPRLLWAQGMCGAHVFLASLCSKPSPGDRWPQARRRGGDGLWQMTRVPASPRTPPLWLAATPASPGCRRWKR